MQTIKENIDLYKKSLHKDVLALTRFRVYYGEHPLQEMGLRLKDLNFYIDQLVKQSLVLKNIQEEYEERIKILESDSRFTHIRNEVASLPEYIRYPKWYSLKSNIASLRKLVDNLGLLEQYDGSYGNFSQS